MEKWDNKSCSPCLSRRVKADNISTRAPRDDSAVRKTTGVAELLHKDLICTHTHTHTHTHTCTHLHVNKRGRVNTLKALEADRVLYLSSPLKEPWAQQTKRTHTHHKHHHAHHHHPHQNTHTQPAPGHINHPLVASLDRSTRKGSAEVLNASSTANSQILTQHTHTHTLSGSAGPPAGGVCVFWCG